MHLAIPLETMTTTDKLQAIEEIWTDLVRNLDANKSEDVLSPSWHTDVLRAREQRIADGVSRFLDIAEAKQAVREKIE
uniref:Addiction module component n=1 Tax=Candidatus Kentrum sp. TC TaxID=2126339 RepID=A0A450ZK26_9GAMM|nr:MAG: Putative addiction module component [Candidatus Kentron sp. TC]VFK54121.1 MAG: Putative addiction module component [Candidatus Kentron sp. TC]